MCKNSDEGFLCVQSSTVRTLPLAIPEVNCIDIKTIQFIKAVSQGSG